MLVQGGDTDSLASVDSSTLHSTPTTDFDAWNGPAAAAAGADAKINPLAQAQLRHLLQAFLDAECLDWALIVAVILRDAMALLRLVGLARTLISAASATSNSHALALETATRLRDGLLALSHWSETESPGYRPFIAAVYAQVGVLTKLLLVPAKNQPSPRTSATPSTLPSPLPSAAAGDADVPVRPSRFSTGSSTVPPLDSVRESTEELALDPPTGSAAAAAASAASAESPAPPASSSSSSPAAVALPPAPPGSDDPAAGRCAIS